MEKIIQKKLRAIYLKLSKDEMIPAIIRKESAIVTALHRLKAKDCLGCEKKIFHDFLEIIETEYLDKSAVITQLVDFILTVKETEWIRHKNKGVGDERGDT